MRPAEHPSARRIQAVLGPKFKVLEFAETTRTAADAAAAIGCDTAQIAKSIVFRATPSDRLVLVITSGANRVDERKIQALLGEKVERADADYVRSRTGFAIGGVPPVGHKSSPIVFIDHDLKKLPTIWAAAGTPNAVFELTADDLLSLTQGSLADVAKSAS